MNRRILITGGAGFIGSNLADELLFHGYQVRAFADVSRAERVPGYAPHVSPEDGLDQLVTWLARHTSVDKVEKARAELSMRGLTV